MYFAYSSFQGDVWFHDHYLPGHERIPAARFAGHANFKGVKFSKSARFNDAFPPVATARWLASTMASNRRIGLIGIHNHVVKPLDPMKPT